MKEQNRISCCSRRSFLQLGTALTLGGVYHPAFAEQAQKEKSKIETVHKDAKVAIVPCKEYGKEVKTAYERCFDLLGGIGKLVKNKTVTVKVNLTAFYDRPNRRPSEKPAGETFITHGDTALALTSLLLENGAKCVRIVECAYTRNFFEDLLERAQWDVDALLAMGNVELENTRNLGFGKKYSTLPVPDGGYLFSHFELNHSYEDTDVFISLSKMKNHTIAGVTLAMKNLFGITPNSRYGGEAGSEDAISGRTPLHGMRVRRRWEGGEAKKIDLPGEKDGDFPRDAGYRIPRIIADLCAARPIHLSIIDGITSIRGSETPNRRYTSYTSPGVLIAGLNPVSTDAVGTAVMGYKDPCAKRGTAPFIRGDNHIVLADRCGIGTADLTKIEVLGAPIKEVIYPYDKEVNS